MKETKTASRPGRLGQIETETQHFNGVWKVKVYAYERNAATLKTGWVVKITRKFMTAEGAKLFADGYEGGVVRCAF